MENVKIKEFLSIETNCGYGYGSLSGVGYDEGFGYGYGHDFSSGYNSSCGSGFGSGAGHGFGFGCTCGYGHGLGPGEGSGSGFGDCDCGWCIKTFLGEPVYIIDDIPTIIRSIRGNIAKCMILKVDLTTTPCFVVKIGNSFAHGKTIKKAFMDAQAKHFNELPEIDERLQAFVDAHEWGVEYPDTDFYNWHNKLTGSCTLGRDMFAQEHGLEKLDGRHTVEWFINLTKDTYGSEIIKKIPKLYGKE